MKRLLFFLAIFPMCLNAQWNLIYNHSDQESALAVTNQDSIIVVTYASSGGGRIHHSFDAGQTWSFDQTIFTTSWFLDVDFPTSTIGYASGGSHFGLHKNIISKTTDGGLTWNPLTSNVFPGYEFSNIDFVNINTGFVSSPWIWSSLLKTTDGGQNFTSISIPDIEIVSEIYFLSPDLGFISGYSYLDSSEEYERLILRTTDLGVSWTTVYANKVVDAGNRGINAIYFVNKNIGYAVGNNGLFLKTTDGGNTWNSTLIPPYTNLTALHFTSPNVGYINNAGGIYKTTDGGTTWTVQNIFPLDIIRDIRFANDTIGYALGEDGIYKTINGGGTGLSMEKFNRKIELIVYPNPATDILYIETPEKLSVQKIRLLDIRGKIVQEYPGNARQLDVSNFAAGNYFLQVFTQQGETTKKVVVE